MSASPPDPPPDLESTRPAAPGVSAATSFGPYRLLQKVGEGGMGEVWLAEQVRPVRRHVAVKVIKAGMDTAQVVTRFEAERQALALMDHPAIATVYDGGSTPEGRPYFAMEYVKGEPITTYCDRQRLTTQARLELFMQVCEGVQHAHQKGVIHRDLKPSNVLVTIQGDRPVPKIIDFGVAKATARHLTEHTLYTELGVMIGTPEYMSPEQAEMGALDIDTRTDVYALGVILYELLTGALPFDRKELRQAGVAEIQRTIREKEPPRPSTRVTQLGPASADAAANRHTEVRRLARELRGDLDWVTMRALEKDRTRRYPTANALAADLRRHLGHLPVFAGPPSTAYQVRKFVRRHRIGVLSSAVVLLVLIGGIAGTTMGLLRAVEAERKASEEAESARQVSDFLVGLFQVSDPSEARGNSITAREVLDKGAARIDKDLKGQPQIQSRLMHTMAKVYQSLGLYPAALTLLEKSLSLRKTLYGEDHLQVVEVLQTLGELQYYQGRYDESLATFRRLLAIRERVLGVDHPDVASSANDLGVVLLALGRYDEALPLYERALAIREKVFRGQDAFAIAETLHNLGTIMSIKDRYAEAEGYFRRCLAIKEKAFGADHPQLAITLTSLGWNLSGRGKFVDAGPFLERALAISRKNLPPGHLEIARAAAELGRNEATLHRFASAEALLKDALAVTLAAVGPSSDDVAGTYGELGILYEKQGRYQEAEPLLRQALQLLEQKFGREHLRVAQTMNALARVCRETGRLDEALTLYTTALGVDDKKIGPGNLASARDLGGLSETSFDRGQLVEAERSARRSIAAFEAARQGDHPYLVWPCLVVARTMTATGRSGEAEVFFKRALETVEHAYPRGHGYTAVAAGVYADYLRNTGRKAEAEALTARIPPVQR